MGLSSGFPRSSESEVPINQCVSLPPQADCFYIHDLAVAQQRQKHGIGTALVKQALGLARQADYRRVLLVAVQASSGFWARLGFELQKEVSYAGLPANRMYFIL